MASVKGAPVEAVGPGVQGGSGKSVAKCCFSMKEHIRGRCRPRSGFMTLDLWDWDS